MPNSKLIWLAKKGVATPSASSALSTSAQAPNSGLAFVDNSQGASAAVAELAEKLDFALDQLDLENELRDQIKQQLRELNSKAAGYTNSDVPEGMGAKWTCSPIEAELLSAAWECSTAVHDPKLELKVPGMAFRQVKYSETSTFGTIKATGIWTVNIRNNVPAPLKVLVIAIRGTASNVDRMVLLNAKEGDATKDNFIDLHLAGASDPLYFHAGFLNSAKAIAKVITSEVKSRTSGGAKIDHVVLTGHSAGGSTASILYAHYVSQIFRDDPSITFSLVTFGAAPVSTRDITPLLLHCAGKYRKAGLALAVVNEFDLVPRADGPYVRSLVDLYRAKDGLPPITDAALSKLEARHLSGSETLIVEREQSAATGQEPWSAREWPLPKQQYHLIGDVLLLRMRLQHQVNCAPHQSDIVSQPKLEAVKISRDDLGRLVFCSVDTHKRLCYEERIRTIRQDLLNGGQQFGQEEIRHHQPTNVTEALDPHLEVFPTMTTLRLLVDERKTTLSQDNEIDN